MRSKRWLLVGGLVLGAMLAAYEVETSKQSELGVLIDKGNELDYQNEVLVQSFQKKWPTYKR